MSVPKWRRSGSKLDAFYEAVKLRHIVTQMIMRSYGMKTKHKSLIPDRLRDEYPDLVKLFEKIDKYQTKVEETKVLSKYDDFGNDVRIYFIDLHGANFKSRVFKLVYGCCRILFWHAIKEKWIIYTFCVGH